MLRLTWIGVGSHRPNWATRKSHRELFVGAKAHHSGVGSVVAVRSPSFVGGVDPILVG